MSSPNSGGAFGLKISRFIVISLFVSALRHDT
jgi:hypothetical protein